MNRATIVSRTGVWWNWKAALTSACLRGALFFAVNSAHGADAARSAFLTEFALRGVMSGFYGAMTSAFRHVHPPWKATVMASLLLPVLSHGVELVVHWARGTEALAASIAASVALTAVSTAFNLHVMRHGVMTVGEGSQSLAKDLRALPGLALSFLGVRSAVRA
jgi:hypothetical protein